MDALFYFLFVLIMCFIYFVPTIVAFGRGHKNALAIFILNLFLGYTLVGWVIALIWAVYNSETPAKKRK